MLGRVIYAAAVGAVVALLIVIVGPPIATAGVPIISDLFAQLVKYAIAVGVVVALLSFLGGWSLPTNRPTL